MEVLRIPSTRVEVLRVKCGLFRSRHRTVRIPEAIGGKTVDLAQTPGLFCDAWGQVFGLWTVKGCHLPAQRALGRSKKGEGESEEAEDEAEEEEEESEEDSGDERDPPGRRVTIVTPNGQRQVPPPGHPPDP